MRYLPLTAEDRREMLSRIGVREKIGRSIRGTVKTYCRCGTGARTFSSTHSP